MADLREIERESIRAFVQRAADEGYLSGRVLDYGCGKQPYRDIVEANKDFAKYEAYDQKSFPGNTSGKDVGPPDPDWPHAWDVVLSTQVVQYVPDVPLWLRGIHDFLLFEGHLVMTYPTNWPEVEPEDLHRFTKSGMERLLTEAGFEIVLHQLRAESQLVDGGDWVALGYGCVARA